ncbi:hypothetical protein DW322_02420 [Rhodococcus rhodnii]|uniref:Uncharacterized protein n=2 Tax=Rhodococcus rhodnii TaxID=38312 RepID=R7WI10_9NOCA|nr:hypothetical protein [Rhodococcus rhodnii]EOM74793.1 hypothetical protein Rrhod_3874 [Rhodococcus rhodnii LMG 5362]TXG89301.1 hypothetical protein DW322_02420 [Rhodococcus rhodnii]
MSQLSFFSADLAPPDVADLAGLLAGTGQAVAAPAGARISTVVADDRRARALAAAVGDSGVAAEVTTSDEGSPLVRTARDPALDALVRDWTRGAVKAVPAGWVPTARALRLWAIASGHVEHGSGADTRYVLALDRHAPDTFSPLVAAMIRAGIAPTLVGTRGGSPGLRIGGRRRVTRLLESIGDCPPELHERTEWPTLTERIPRH